MPKTLLTIATRKGTFLAESDDRRDWTMRGPYCEAWPLLTVVHDQLEGAPKTAESVAGGWMYVLSGLKTLLETGKPLVS